jgi:hypothetical protein
VQAETLKTKLRNKPPPSPGAMEINKRGTQWQLTTCQLARKTSNGHREALLLAAAYSRFGSKAVIRLYNRHSGYRPEHQDGEPTRFVTFAMSALRQ